MGSEDQPSMSVDFLMNEKDLQTLNNALGTLERIFCVTDGKSSKHDNLGKYSSTLTDARHPNKKDSYSCSQSREHINFLAYLDSLEFVCKILLQPANAVWESFFKEKTVPTSGKMTCVLMALNQFIDSSLFAYR